MRKMSGWTWFCPFHADFKHFPSMTTSKDETLISGDIIVQHKCQKARLWDAELKHSGLVAVGRFSGYSKQLPGGWRGCWWWQRLKQSCQLMLQAFTSLTAAGMCPPRRPTTLCPENSTRSWRPGWIMTRSVSYGQLALANFSLAVHLSLLFTRMINNKTSVSYKFYIK